MTAGNAVPKTGPAGKPEPDRKLLKAVVRLVVKLMLVAAVIWAVYMFAGVPFRMSGNYMFPSVRDGDLCIFSRLGDVYTGDVVLYDTGEEKRLGRIVAREGQEIDFPEGGGYLVDGYAPAESIPYDTYRAEGTAPVFPFSIGEGEIFLLNDYREDTGDGRTFGAVKKAQVIGKLVFILRRRGF